MLVMVVALLVFGPEKLPEMARNLGRTASQLRRMAQDMKDDFSTALDDDEEDRPAPGSGSTRPRAAGALPADDDSAEDATAGASVAPEEDAESSSIQASAKGGSDADEEVNKSPTLHNSSEEGSDADEEDDESSSIKDDLERLNRQQQEAEAAATTTRMGDSKVERSE